MAKKPKQQFRHGPPPVVSYTPEQVAAHELEMQILINRKNPFGGSPVNLTHTTQHRKEIPLVTLTPKSSLIEWRAMQYPVTPNIAEWFKAMIDAQGQPVGASNYVRKATEALEKLEADAPALRAIVEKSAGNRGYRLTVFDAPNVGRNLP